jgi:hypothetical protein
LQGLSNIMDKLAVDLGQLDHGVLAFIAVAVGSVVPPGIGRGQHALRAGADCKLYDGRIASPQGDGDPVSRVRNLRHVFASYARRSGLTNATTRFML